MREARKKGTVQKTVSEILSPPRVSAQAQLVGLRPGFAIDLETKREDGEHWDLSKHSHVEDLFTLLDKEKPTLLGGSPPCGPFSILENLVDAMNLNQVPASVRAKRLQEGKKHLRTSARAYRKQMDEGHYFCMSTRRAHIAGKKLKSRNFVMIRVYMKSRDQCVVGRWKLPTHGAYRPIVKKETRWLTNSRRVLKHARKDLAQACQPH